MGLFDIFRGKKEEPEKSIDETIYTMPLEEVTQWFDEQFENELEMTAKQIETQQSRILESISGAREKLLDLGNSTFESTGKTRAVVNMTKNSFVTRAVSIIDKLNLSETNEYSGIKEFNSKIMKSLREINKVSPKQAFLLSKYFNEKNRESMITLKEVKDGVCELQKLLDSDGKVIILSQRLKSNVEQINDLTEQFRELENNEKNTREVINKLDVTKKDTAEKLDTLRNSSECMEMEKLEETVHVNTAELDGIEREANEMLNSVKRPLKKLRHLLESKDDFLENPFRGIVLGNREELLIKMIEEAKTNASEGKITIKPKENGKLETVKNYIISELPKIKKNYRLLSDSSRDAKQRIGTSGLAEKRSGIEQELLKNEQELKTQWSELDSKIQEKKRIKTEIQELKQKSEKIVLESGKKLSIKL